MTNYEKALLWSRLEPKLKLWETQGFYQFLEDLQQQMGPEIGVKQQIEALRKSYIEQKEQLQPKRKLKQTKIPFK